ncbi:haloalkane dehalogenase [Nocardia stercoris]|uniref:Alpha/beta fold hydrolase n=1 Tax=Nocardia stercoris TaxID=2483361 RepID=A0A3M2LCJ9_9NOCA|nr:haloalkane dehalogenase [Nocardia stercoris]RMI35279.1 alpha/beta fold hydrolase [Nocardia stercoris]
MHVLRTPDERFADLPDFPFEPHYTDVAAGDGSDTHLRLHYLDEGPRGGAVVLLMHGEPSWSFLYRSMIPVLVRAGFRCVAPDLIGFGRSDKPAERADYTYARHVEWVREALFDRLDLRGITLVCQDWGGLIGLRLVAEHPDRFARVVVANAGLPTGSVKLTEAFAAWQRFSQETTEFPVGGIVAGGCRTQLTPDVIAGYDAPFPDETYKAGARVFPLLVPTRPDDPAGPANSAAWERLAQFGKPLLTAFSDGDPITKGGDRVFREKVPGAAGQPHTTITGAGHFLQEDRGPDLATVITEFIAATPTTEGSTE